MALENTPGTKYVYSNLGYGLLGIVVARAGRAPFRDVVSQRVLAPLGMTATVWDRASVPAGRLAASHSRGADGLPAVTGHSPVGAGEGSGGLYSTVRDLARYVAFQLAAYPPRSSPEDGPVRRSSVREGHFHALRARFPGLEAHPGLPYRLVEVGSQRYGYGWSAERMCEQDELIRHSGGIDGYRSLVAFLPERGVGVIVLLNLADVTPEPVVGRVLAELQRTGGLSKRALALTPAFEPAMQKFLAVYNAWDEAAHGAMRVPGHPDLPIEEKKELEGYKKLHGACRSYTPLVVRAPGAAVFKIDCERGVFEMDVTLGDDGRIAGLAGTSRDLPIPPELRTVGQRVAGMIKRWDESTYRKHLARTKRPRQETVTHFEDLREAHGACRVKSLMNVVFDRKLVLACDRGGDLVLSLSLDSKHPDAVTSYEIERANEGACVAR